MDSKPFKIQRLTGELVEAFDLGDEEEAKRIAARYLVALGGLAPNRRLCLTRRESQGTVR
jgi:hypothetical protein